MGTLRSLYIALCDYFNHQLTSARRDCRVIVYHFTDQAILNKGKSD